MKTNSFILNKVVRMVCAALPFYLFTFLPLNVSAQKQLLILHTNDTHSTILPLNPNLEDTMKAGRGGFLRRIVMLKEERKKDPDLLYFDSGDFSQGSGYYTMFKGDTEIGLMNMMGIDAATIGNHEFDFGLDNMARIFKMATFPIVCTNYDFKGTVCEGLVKPYITLKRKGVKIGVFALAPKMKGLVSDKNGTRDGHHAEEGPEVRHGDMHLTLRMGCWRRRRQPRDSRIAQHRPRAGRTLAYLLR